MKLDIEENVEETNLKKPNSAQHPSLTVAWSVLVQHMLYMHSVVLSSQATQCRVKPARFMQQM